MPPHGFYMRQSWTCTKLFSNLAPYDQLGHLFWINYKVSPFCINASFLASKALSVFLDLSYLEMSVDLIFSITPKMFDMKSQCSPSPNQIQHNFLLYLNHYNHGVLLYKASWICESWGLLFWKSKIHNCLILKVHLAACLELSFVLSDIFLYPVFHCILHTWTFHG